MMEQFTKQVGVPFRETHHIAGAAVALAESEGAAFYDLSLAALPALHPAFDEDVTGMRLNYGKGVNLYAAGASLKAGIRPRGQGHRTAILARQFLEKVNSAAVLGDIGGEVKVAIAAEAAVGKYSVAHRTVHFVCCRHSCAGGC